MLVSLIFSKKFIFAPKLAKIENEKNDEKYSKKKVVKTQRICISHFHEKKLQKIFKRKKS